MVEMSKNHCLRMILINDRMSRDQIIKCTGWEPAQTIRLMDRLAFTKQIERNQHGWTLTSKGLEIAKRVSGTNDILRKSKNLDFTMPEHGSVKPLTTLSEKEASLPCLILDKE